MSGEIGDIAGPAGLARAAQAIKAGYGLGQVATRCQTPDVNTAGYKDWVCRSYRYMRDGVTRFRLVIGYGCIAAQIETDPGGPATFWASVEYPTGNHVRVRFAGAVKGQCAGLAYLVSDWIDLAVPAGALWGCTIQGNAPVGGAVYNSYAAGQVRAGDSTLLATGGSPDYTMGAAFTATHATAAFYPAAVIAETVRPSAILIGDSRAFAAHDTADASGDLGELQRGVGGSYGYICVAKSSDQARYFGASHEWRLALARYASCAIVEYGINDVANSRTAAQIAADTDAILGWLPPGMPAFATTITPQSTSTDGWATIANQTKSSKDAVRTTENDRRRAVPIGWAGCIEVADAVETARNSGVWQAGLTDDGTHGVQPGLLAIAAAGTVRAAVPARAVPAGQMAAAASRRLHLMPTGRTLAAIESGRTITNEGATAKASFTLPPAVQGLEYGFVVQNALGIRVTAAANNTVRIAGVGVSASAGYAESVAQGAVLTLAAINAGEWIATRAVGSWAVT